jgi:hypothetical protein
VDEVNFKQIIKSNFLLKKKNSVSNHTYISIKVPVLKIAQHLCILMIKIYVIYVIISVANVMVILLTVLYVIVVTFYLIIHVI